MLPEESEARVSYVRTREVVNQTHKERKNDSRKTESQLCRVRPKEEIVKVKTNDV